MIGKSRKLIQERERDDARAHRDALMDDACVLLMLHKVATCDDRTPPNGMRSSIHISTLITHDMR